MSSNSKRARLGEEEGRREAKRGTRRGREEEGDGEGEGGKEERWRRKGENEEKREEV